MLKFQSVLQELREEKQISQSQLAKAIGVSTSAIGNYEAGLREPSFETLEKIADYFNVSLGTLLGDRRTARMLAYYEKLSLLMDKAAKLDNIDIARLTERIDTMLENDKYKEV